MEFKKPECEYGYTPRQVEEMLPGRLLNRFIEWNVGRSGPICDGRVFNYKTKKYEPSGCGPHGMIYWPEDVRLFLSTETTSVA